MTGTRGKVRLCAALLVLVLAFIWGNSLLSGSDSGAMSGGIVTFLLQWLALQGVSLSTLHVIVRKLAHFSEFACLGMLLAWWCGMARTRRSYPVLTPMLWAMAAALIDETIQMFIPDRGPSLTDVWIDICGAAAGMLLYSCGYHLMKRIKQNKQ